MKLPSQEIRNFPYQEKLQWFKKQMERLKISWELGNDVIQVDANNVLQSSLESFEKINFHKEVKVAFKNDKVQDAGGLLREWIYIIQKQIFGKSSEKYFIQADTDDITYKINPKLDPQNEQILKAFKLFGKILAKAIIEKIPLQCHLDQLIIKQILNQKVQINDLYFYDKHLYQSFLYLKNNIISEDDCIGNFTYEQYELIPDGKNIQINNDNKLDYMQKVLDFVSYERVKPFMQNLFEGFYSLIPQDFIEVFECNEFLMITYGLPFISLKDWKDNTIYKNGYYPQHPIIVSFWKILSTLNQQQLAKFLHFCTGSQRIGIDGFRKLESNREMISKFCIEQVQYNLKNPFLKAHTCFNRLELPLYSSEEQLLNNIQIILHNNFDGIFGMEQPHLKKI